MTAEVIPFGDFQLCPCGAGVANLPVPGGLVCVDCFDEIEAQRKCASVAETWLSDPGEKETLDDLLARLVQS